MFPNRRLFCLLAVLATAIGLPAQSTSSSASYQLSQDGIVVGAAHNQSSPSYRAMSVIGQPGTGERSESPSFGLESGTLTDTLFFPQNVRTGGGKESIRIAWDPNINPGFFGYNIYRQDPGASGTRTKLNAAPLVSPEYFDGPPDNPALTNGKMFEYLVESLTSVDGATVTAISEPVLGQEGRFVLTLPEIRGIRAEGGAGPPDFRVRFPVSTLNARGITQNAFVVSVAYPSDIVENVTFERTALTQSFSQLEGFAGNQMGKTIYTVRALAGAPGGLEINGEGPFFNLVFNIKSSVALGEEGEFSFNQVELFSGGSVLPVDSTDKGTLSVLEQFRLGDIDGNSQIGFSDVVASKSIIGGGEVTNPLSFDAGDINADGLFDLADIPLIFPKIGSKSLGKGSGNGKYSFRIISSSFAMGTTFPSSEVVEVPIQLVREGNPGGIAGVDMSLRFNSDELEYEGFSVTEGADRFSNADQIFVDRRDLQQFVDPNLIRIIMYSNNNSEKDFDGEICRILFKAVGTPSSTKSAMDLFQVNSAKNNGEKIRWNNDVEILDGDVFFIPPEGPTETPTATPSFTEIPPPGSTDTPTATPSSTATSQPESTPTSTPEPGVPTATPTNTEVGAPTVTPTPSASESETPTRTPEFTETPTESSTLTVTSTPTETRTFTPVTSPTPGTPRDLLTTLMNIRSGGGNGSNDIFNLSLVWYKSGKN